ncbi:microtubule-associated protein 65-5 [Forsythia ovata]|uniref:Microtubule-associated protein 65-5 n=1 Tax=Forsythia ovata TaxID=205694 RepID=A0ABD1TPS1_9LAMI
MSTCSGTANYTSSPLSFSKTTTTTCSSLLHELQEIWDEIGESDNERDEMLLQLEHECLDIYRKKVETSKRCKADLHHSLAEAKAKIAELASALGERISLPQYEKMGGNIKEQISVINPTLENLKMLKHGRVREFSELQLQIAQICAEIADNDQTLNPDDIQVDELDLTTKKLGQLNLQLLELQSERNFRLQKVNSHISAIHKLSVVMSLDFKRIMAEIHPSLIDSPTGQSKSISNETLARLTSEVNSLMQNKQWRLEKVQDLGSTLIELWNLMETPIEEQKRFNLVTRLITSTVDEVVSQECLSSHVIEQTEAEVARLNTLKASKMKELIFKRQNELEEIYSRVHMDVDREKAREILISLMESGSVNLSDLLSSMEEQIAKAREQAQSRKDILDKVEKWKHASEEESWLDEYERDDNRYNAGRGAHKNLKRAEKARTLVSKIPSLVENLTAKVKAWELDKGMQFLYNKAPLLRTLEEFTNLRQEKEEEKRRYREQKKLQDQLAAEQEALFGSKPSIKKPLCVSTNGNTMVATPNSRRVESARHGISGGREQRDSVKAIPINYVALPKDDRGV